MVPIWSGTVACALRRRSSSCRRRSSVFGTRLRELMASVGWLAAAMPRSPSASASATLHSAAETGQRSRSESSRDCAWARAASSHSSRDVNGSAPSVAASASAFRASSDGSPMPNCRPISAELWNPLWSLRSNAFRMTSKTSFFRRVPSGSFQPVDLAIRHARASMSLPSRLLADWHFSGDCWKRTRRH